jgi:hypothetical protein
MGLSLASWLPSWLSSAETSGFSARWGLCVLVKCRADERDLGDVGESVRKGS